MGFPFANTADVVAMDILWGNSIFSRIPQQSGFAETTFQFVFVEIMEARKKKGKKIK